MSSQKSIVAVAGMPGSGKSLVINIAIQNGYEPIAMGDVVREEAKRRNLPPTPENIGRIMLELRHAEGDAVIAKRCVPRIENASKAKVVLDGIRSLSEVEEFRKHFRRFALIAIQSSPETRFRRIYNRQRSDDSKDRLAFRERDMRELGVGLGNAIAMAEYVIVNEGGAESARDVARTILRRVETRWMT